MSISSGVRYFKVDVSSLGRFATFTGGEPSVTIGNAWNGGAKVPDRVQSRKVFANITVSRPYWPSRDRPLEHQLHAWLGTAKVFNITKQDLDANDIAIGSVKTWSGCILVRIGEPAYSEEDSSPAMWELEFAPQQRK